LLKLLNNTEVAELFRKMGRQRAEQFSMRTLAEMYIPLYERVVSRFPFAT
jgi:glycosyltransferase involved in cell wall biosynthesis